MKTNAPKSTTLMIAILLGVLSALGEFDVVASLGEYSWWLLLFALALLVLGSTTKGL